MRWRVAWDVIVHRFLRECRNYAPCFGTWGTPRLAYWLTATEAEVEKHLLPILHTRCAERYHGWKDDPVKVEDETLDGRWSFLVPENPNGEDSPMFFFRVFPYSGMQQEHFERLPNAKAYESDDEVWNGHAWLEGVEIETLADLPPILA